MPAITPNETFVKFDYELLRSRLDLSRTIEQGCEEVVIELNDLAEIVIVGCRMNMDEIEKQIRIRLTLGMYYRRICDVFVLYCEPSTANATLKSVGYCLCKLDKDSLSNISVSVSRGSKGWMVCNGRITSTLQSCPRVHRVNPILERLDTVWDQERSLLKVVEVSVWEPNNWWVGLKAFLIPPCPELKRKRCTVIGGPCVEVNYAGGDPLEVAAFLSSQEIDFCVELEYSSTRVTYHFKTDYDHRMGLKYLLYSTYNGTKFMITAVHGNAHVTDYSASSKRSGQFWVSSRYQADEPDTRASSPIRLIGGASAAVNPAT